MYSKNKLQISDFRAVEIEMVLNQGSFTSTEFHVLIKVYIYGHDGTFSVEVSFGNSLRRDNEVSDNYKFQEDFRSS